MSPTPVAAGLLLALAVGARSVAPQPETLEGARELLEGARGSVDRSIGGTDLRPEVREQRGAAASPAGPSRGVEPPGPPAWREPFTGMVFVQVPAGSFVMGSPAGEPDREAQERQHRVTLTKPFWIGRFEVTQAEWRQVMGSDPSHFHGDDLPVESVSWHGAQAFLTALSARSPGSRFRLPTEAEWEYACRAGTTAAFATGARLDGMANVAATPDTAASGATMPVGSFAANAWGLHDMHGNVWEWTADAHCPYDAGAVTDPRPACGARLKVIRGGSWRFLADSARCALRYTHRPQDTGPSLGFRVVREPAAGAVRHP